VEKCSITAKCALEWLHAINLLDRDAKKNTRRESASLQRIKKLAEGECYYSSLAGSIHGFTACGDVTAGEISLA
jgi:hypothetical protein